MINVTNLLCGKQRPSDGVRREGRDAGGGVSECKPAVVWNITRRCNLRCAHCYSDSAAKHYPGELTLEQMVVVIDDLSEFRVPAVVLSGGDPMFHPHFFDAEEAKNNPSSVFKKEDFREAKFLVLRFLGGGNQGRLVLK